MVVFIESSCIPEKSFSSCKVVVFGQKKLYTGKTVVFGQSGSSRTNVVVFGKVVFFR